MAQPEHVQFSVCCILHIYCYCTVTDTQQCLRHLCSMFVNSNVTNFMRTPACIFFLLLFFFLNLGTSDVMDEAKN